jgi:hypothetical protein
MWYFVAPCYSGLSKLIHTVITQIIGIVLDPGEAASCMILGKLLDLAERKFSYLCDRVE